MQESTERGLHAVAAALSNTEDRPPLRKVIPAETPTARFEAKPVYEARRTLANLEALKSTVDGLFQEHINRTKDYVAASQEFMRALHSVTHDKI